MRIITLLTPVSRNALVEACSGERVTFVPVSALFLTTFPGAEPDLVVCDPEFLAQPPVAEALCEFSATYPHVGILVIGHLTPALAQLAAAVGHGRVITVALPVFDTPRALWRFVREAVVVAARERVLWELAPNLAILPDPIAAAVRVVFRDKRYARDTMETLATLAECDRRTIYRWLNRAGLAQPKDLLRAARLLHGLPLITQRGKPLHRVAELLHYPDYGQFQEHTERVFGLTPRALRFHLAVEETASVVARRLLAHQSGRSSSRSILSSVPSEPYSPVDGGTSSESSSSPKGGAGVSSTG